MPIEKILITGASGYLAQFVIDRLRGAYQLTLTDIAEPDRAFPDTTFIKAGRDKPAEIEAACAGQDAVVHLVALVRERFGKPASLFADVMVKGTWNVAEACVQQGVQKLVNISSISACHPAPGAKLPYTVGDDFVFGPRRYLLFAGEVPRRADRCGVSSGTRIGCDPRPTGCYCRRRTQPWSDGS